MVPTFSAVLFDTDKSDLTTEGTRELQKVADYMNANPGQRVRIQGYTDSTGTAQYNQALSERRAAAVKTALIRQGVDPSRIDMKGYGESNAMAANSSAEGRQQNRRAEMTITGEEGNMATAQAAQPDDSQARPMAQPQTAAINPGDYTGKVITTANGQRVGTVNRLISKDSNQDVYALVDVDSSLGLGADQIAVPLSQLQSQGGQWRLTVDMTKAEAQNRVLYNPAEFSAFELTNQPQPPMNK